MGLPFEERFAAECSVPPVDLCAVGTPLAATCARAGLPNQMRKVLVT